MTLPEDLHAFERKKIQEALTKAKGVQTHAAKLLGIHERTVRKRLAVLFTDAERAEMAKAYGWQGKKEKK